MVRFVATLGAVSLAAAQAQAWWQPTVGMSWQITLSVPLKDPSADFEVFDFDLFDNPASTIQAVHNNGHKVICYFSAGSYENWRADADEFKSSDLGKPLDGWPGERWVNTNSANVRRIMKQRMDLAVSKGCDAIDPDNMDPYQNGGGGFNLKKADAIDYVKFFSSEGHQRGLAVGLKNAGGIIPQVLSDVDFAVNEQCLQYKECKVTRPFINAGKPVFEIEYVKGTPTAQKVAQICNNPTRSDFSTLIKHMNLDAWYEDCRGSAKKCRDASPSPNGAQTSLSPGGGSNTGSQLFFSASVLVGVLSLTMVWLV